MMDSVCDLCKSENCIVTDGDYDWQQWECLDCGNAWREYDDSDDDGEIEGWQYALWNSDKPEYYHEQPLSHDDKEDAADFLRRLIALMDGTGKECLRCGKPIEGLEQIGNSVYAVPCQCRQYLGGLPHPRPLSKHGEGSQADDVEEGDL